MIAIVCIMKSPWWLPPLFMGPYLIPILFLAYALFRQRFTLRFLLFATTAESIALALAQPEFLRYLLGHA